MTMELPMAGALACRSRMARPIRGMYSGRARSSVSRVTPSMNSRTIAGTSGSASRTRAPMPNSPAATVFAIRSPIGIISPKSSISWVRNLTTYR